MKKRRLTIIAFLLCATLLMGIGYASVSGSLTINGTAAYAPESLVNSATVSFANPVANACTVVLSNSNTVATVDVSFADNNGVTDPAGHIYTATAQLDVVYTGDANLADLRVEVVKETDFDVAGFTCSYEWIANDNVVGPGETVKILVTIQYTVQDPVPSASVNDSFVLKLNYAPVA